MQSYNDSRDPKGSEFTSKLLQTRFPQITTETVMTETDSNLSASSDSLVGMGTRDGEKRQKGQLDLKMRNKMEKVQKYLFESVWTGWQFCEKWKHQKLEMVKLKKKI